MLDWIWIGFFSQAEFPWPFRRCYKNVWVASLVPPLVDVDDVVVLITSTYFMANQLQDIAFFSGDFSGQSKDWRRHMKCGCFMAYHLRIFGPESFCQVTGLASKVLRKPRWSQGSKQSISEQIYSDDRIDDEVVLNWSSLIIIDSDDSN